MASYVEIVQRESMFDPSTSLLMNGASKGLHDFLAEHGDESFPQTETVEGFKAAYLKAVNQHPELSHTEMLYAALHAMLKPLDEPYTRFLSPVEFGHLQARVQGTDECGLGCHLELDDHDVLTVVETFEDTPATAAGLRAGDRLTAIDGRQTVGLSLSACKDLLSGSAGSLVRLAVVRDDTQLDVSVRRAHVEVPNVTFELLGPGVGYLRLHAFSANAGSEVDHALTELEKLGATSYVFDLRDNRGGYVSSAIDVCSRFLAPGTKIMSLQQKRRPTINYTSYAAPTVLHTRLVLLVNQRTASASEIVAGCLQDYKIATLLGTRTFGKGLVQKVIPLPDGSAFAISTGKYLTAMGRDLHKRGIPPDVVAAHIDVTSVVHDPEVRQAALMLGQHQGLSSRTP